MVNRFSLSHSIPSNQEIQFLEDRLYEFNRDKTGKDNGHLFAVLIRNTQQEIVAGVSGWTWADACEIRTFWVHASLRGQGYGKELLEAAENEAKLRGCKVILIISYSFQAPGFYQKFGYEAELKISDFPPGHQNYYLIKRL